MPNPIAALYVETGGAYFGLPDVDPWDASRDARGYDGPYPVVAHPPCARWGNYWYGSPSSTIRKTLGDDGGCFARALECVRKYGGVLEHPCGSRAWDYFRINRPQRHGGWTAADWEGGWTCCVDQSSYGHRAKKSTWLYAKLVQLPTLNGLAFDAETTVEKMSKKERAATPIPFRDLLIDMARSAYRCQPR